MTERETQQTDNDILIPEPDVVRMVKLIGDVAGMREGLPTRKKALMDGLSEMLDADGWVWTATQLVPGQEVPMSVGVLYDGLTDEQFSGWVDASQMGSPPEDPPLAQLLMRGKHYTRTRQQLVADEVWYNHPTVKQYRLNHGLDHFLYSIYPIEADRCSAIGFFRQTGRKPFTALQRRICHILTGQIEWMHYATFPECKHEPALEMTPRLRSVLIHLLDGRQRDEIAELLVISPETVKEHMKKIYRHFGVNSQIELMRYFQAGNGRDL